MTPYPLAWPVRRPRTKYPQESPFGRATKTGRHTIEKARVFLFEELRRWGVLDGDAVITSNLICRLDGFPRSGQLEPADTGIAVHFRRDGKDYVLACDKWNRTADNLWAIAKHLESVRGQERWGVESSTQALSHYLALPDRGSGPRWWEILGVPATATKEQVRSAFRQKSLTAHPDRGGTASEWEILNTAYQQADATFAGQALIL